MTVIIGHNDFNQATQRAKAFFGGDRHKAQECLSTSLFAQDYNVVAKKLKTQAKTTNGYLATMPQAERKGLLSNLSSLASQIDQFQNQKVRASENAKQMLDEFSGVNGYNGSSPKIVNLLKLIEASLYEISEGTGTERLVLRDVHRITDSHGEHAYDAEVSGELFMDGLTIRWHNLPTESDAEGRCFDSFKSKEEVNLTIGGQHWVEWVKNAEVEHAVANNRCILPFAIEMTQSSVGELIDAIGRCNFDCYTPDIDLPVEIIKAIQGFKVS